MTATQLARTNQLRITAADGRARYQWLREGRAGNIQTLREMSKLVRDALLFELRLADYANGILRAAKVVSDVKRKSWREVEAIFAFVRDRMTFRRDPAGGHEAIQAASVSIARGYGDCDDYSVLLASLLGCCGYLSRFVVVRVDPDPSRSDFDHVYVEAQHPHTKRWVALDATDKQAVSGYEPRKIVERKVFSIFPANASADDLAGIGSFFKKLGAAALPAAGVVAAPFTAGTSLALIGAAGSIGGSLLASGGSGGGALGPQNGKNSGLRERMEYLQTKSKSKKLDKQERGELAQLEAKWKTVDEQQAAAAAAQQKAAEEAKAEEDRKHREIVNALAGRAPDGGGGLTLDNPVVLAGGALALLFFLFK